MVQHRLPQGGRINRSKPLSFKFDGKNYQGFDGDSLASALLANGIKLIGRSFKYHRPRGLMSAGIEEANGIVQLENGPRTEPNVRATVIPLYEGLEAQSQNRWPSLRYDVGAANSLVSRLFPAGFYYKTFKWPASFWTSLYEKVIRNIAGLGKSPIENDPDRYDKIYAHCDLLIVGAGPAGIAAALAAARSGQRIILAELQSEMGGDLLNADYKIDHKPSARWLADALSELRDSPEVTLLPDTNVWGYFDHNYLTMHQSLTEGPFKSRLWRVRAKKVILATGAIERPLVFADNDRPGAMLAYAGQTYAHRYGVEIGKAIVIVTNNDSAYDVAERLVEAGLSVKALIDLRKNSTRTLNGIEILRGWSVTGVRGTKAVRGVTIRTLMADGKATEGAERYITCDHLLYSGGWNPTLHLFSQARGKLRYDDRIQAFVPASFDIPGQNVSVVGAANGHFDLVDCLREGFKAGEEAAGLTSSGHVPHAEASSWQDPIEEFWAVPSDQPIGHGAKHFVDFQNDVTASDIHLAHREGYRSVEHLKRYTTMGMATDQGKTSNVNALALMAELRGLKIPEVGTTTFRPPYSPVTIGTFGGIEKDDLFDPIRMTPIHRWHEDRGAKFELVGQWHRAWYYPRGAETFHQAVQREVKQTREAIGIFDASTLGKIDIQGPDAAKFLNLIYTNAWTKLEPGRCRYGFMLGEDGMVMDDGVTSRIAENHFHMTTTTGNAARVLSWLEEWLQCEWPDLKVYCTSVSEQWAVIALNGPYARALLEEVTEGIDLSDAAFPFMSFREGKLAGVDVRIFRISFTGELSYEINCPPSYAMHLWQVLMQAGEKYGITPYGTEAMHVLRAEKGFVIVGQETDGTITPYDLGHDWIISKQKGDFIGRRSLERSGMKGPHRKHLVGLLTENPQDVLPEGAQIVLTPGKKPPIEMIGHVTSSYMSPNVGRSIAMALVKNGRERMGEWVYLPFDGKVLKAKITEPKFYDIEGKRING